MTTDRHLALMNLMRAIEEPAKTYRRSVRLAASLATDSAHWDAAVAKEYAALDDIDTAVRDWIAAHPAPELLAEVDRLRAALAKEQRLHGDTIDDRDRAQDAADKLAYAVAPEDVIGEHTADNSPWQNALELITPAAETNRLRAELHAEKSAHQFTLRQRNNRSRRLNHLRDMALTGDVEGLLIAAKDTLAASVADHLECGPAAEDLAATDNPTRLRWGLNDVLWGDDDTVIVLLSGPDREPYWLELDPERANVLRQDLAGPDAVETHVVADNSDDPEHIDARPGRTVPAVAETGE